MPEVTTEPVVPAPETVILTATETVFPAPPEPAPEPPPPPAEVPTPEPLLGEAELRELLDGLNAVNTSLEGGEELPAQVMLDPMQFGVLGLVLGIGIALLAFLAVVAMRR